MSFRYLQVVLLGLVGALTLACGNKSGLSSGTGGRSGGLGGASSESGTGGVLGTGGVPGAGGVLGTGGLVGSGGLLGTGGAPGTGGILAMHDAGEDAPPPADAASDPTLQPCGDAACASGQGCALVGGGPAPRCQPQSDGGCPFGLVPVSECSSPGATYYRPGCTDPPPVPTCRTLADGCDGTCACLCPIGGAGCFMREGIAYCPMP